jgi:phage/plasmid-like protein (TIGR03299 family)
MAHELEMVNGLAQMAYRSSAGKPWHGLGNPVSDEMTPQEMLEAAGLDWRVVKADTFARMEINGEMRELPTGQQALIRETDGKVLTQVGPGWNPMQNSEAFDFFREFVAAGDMTMDTAGSLKGGQLVWALADIRDGFTIFGGDEVRGFLLFSNPHVYGKSITVKYVMERVVCANTLAVALGERGKAVVNVNHRATFNSEYVKEVLGLTSENTKKFKEAAEFLGSKSFIKDDLEKYFGKIFGVSDKKDGLSPTAKKALEVIETQPGAEFRPGTWWSALNTVTYMTDHVLGRGNDTRLASAWYGQNAQRKLDALELSLDMANAS